MANINKAILIGGLQNLWQIGSAYPLNLLASLYFISVARFKLTTLLDVLIAGYIAAGVVSLLTGIVFALIDGADPSLAFNAIKSFLVFLTALVYFGAYRLSLEELYDVAMFLFVATVIAILSTYLYIILTNPISLYQSRSAITWCSGWPQRWVVFCLIGYFFFLCRYEVRSNKRDIIFQFMFLAAVILSATRSAILGLLVGHLVLSILSRRDLLRALIIVTLVVCIAGWYFEEIMEAFRLIEITEFSSSDDTDSSMGNRINNLWPGIIDSLGVARIPFGWGHVGLAYIPHEYFVDKSLISNIPGEEAGSAESQYMDVLLRQGVVGLVIYFMILAYGIIYSYKLFKTDPDIKRRMMWKAGLAWQAAAMVHGITVETTRLSIYSLFFFIFLGIVSNSYRRLISQRKSNIMALSGTPTLSRPSDA